MPMSGRFSTTSMALPTHMLAIRPQNNCGLLVMTSGPGCMPLSIMAPTISAITALAGMPSVSMGMNEVCAPALLAASGPGHATDVALAKRHFTDAAAALLFQRVGGKGRQQRAAAGQHPEQRAQHGAAQHGR
jgi:hypothetical protein